MKKLKTNLLLTIAMFVISFGVQAQVDDDVILIRVVETVGTSFMKPRIVTITSSEEVSVISLQRYTLKNYSEAFSENSIAIRKEIQKWMDEGYEVTTSSNDSWQSGNSTLIIMTKENER